MTHPSPPAGGLALLAEAFRSKRTGLLVLGEGSATLRVRLEAGQIVALGQAPAEAMAATPMPKPSDSVRLRLERVLAEIGVRKPGPSGDVPPSPGSGSLRDRLIERLADESQPALFEDGQEAPQDLVAVAVPTEPLMLEAVSQMRDDDAVRAVLGDLDQRLVATTALADERTLTHDEGYLLSRIDGLVSARQVLQLVPFDPGDAERALLGLVLTGRVACLPASAGRRARKPAATPAAAEPPAPEPAAVTRAEPVAEAAPLTDPAPVAQAAAGPQSSPDPRAAVADPVSEVAAEAVGGAAPAAVDAAAIAEDGPTAPTPVPAAPEPLDTAAIERRREILEIFQSLPLKNHFEVLGVEPGCNDAEVRRAYVALAKRYHPDAQRDKRLEDLHDILEAIFIRVGEAWEVLGEAKSRASYEARSGVLQRGRTTPQEHAAASARVAASPSAPAQPGEYVPPEEILHKARQLLAQARYWDAIQMLESALPGMEPRSQQHRGRLLLARAYLKNPKWLRRAEETLQEIVREDPTNADAHYELGLVYKTGGFVARAQGMFRRAAQLQPGHKEASAELGIQTAATGGGGLLKRLFGRGKAS
jgi:tetratricopeptide (TPR) repeat protein